MTQLTQIEFEQLIGSIRPELHRYATRMTGSAVDGEDVVQDALLKAYSAFPNLAHETNVRGWLFRITHNKAIDLIRRDTNEPLELLDEVTLVDYPDMPLEAKELAAFALSMFLKLAPRQRSCVILKDVMGYSLAEISEHLDATIPEIKATLHRGRTRLRELASDTDALPSPLDAHEQSLLARYVEQFNARDFETLRHMLADEVQLELYNRTRLRGAEAIHGNYFRRYSNVHDWRLVLGTVEGRLAILVYDLNESQLEPAYFMLLRWQNDHVTFIGDYHYSRYVLREAGYQILM